jgi:hypothetical protein
MPIEINNGLCPLSVTKKTKKRIHNKSIISHKMLWNIHIGSSWIIIPNRTILIHMHIVALYLLVSYNSMIWKLNKSYIKKQKTKEIHGVNGYKGLSKSTDFERTA